MTEQKSLKRVYIDDIHLINLDGDNDTDKVLEVIQRMRNLAKELKIKIYLISEEIDIWL
jgi:replicative DNA helicase